MKLVLNGNRWRDEHNIFNMKDYTGVLEFLLSIICFVVLYEFLHFMFFDIQINHDSHLKLFLLMFSGAVTLFVFFFFKYRLELKNAQKSKKDLEIEIEELNKREIIIKHMANHDNLTDLPTMRLYKERLSLAIGFAERNKTSIAIMFIDLNGFKEVNDNYGHFAGNDTLKEVAIRLKNLIREADTVARIGGDEFLLAVTDVQNMESAHSTTKKILENLTVPTLYDGNSISIGASIGVSMYPKDGVDIEELIQKADQSMYKIKETGKNGFLFY